MNENTKALRYNEGKPKWSLIHFGSLIPQLRVLMYGAEKYTVKNEDGTIKIDGTDNWKGTMPKKQILDCMMRHLTAIMDGQEIDPESGEPHIGHLQCNAMFYSYHHVIPLSQRKLGSEPWSSVPNAVNKDQTKENIFGKDGVLLEGR